MKNNEQLNEENSGLSSLECPYGYDECINCGGCELSDKDE